MGQVAHFDLSSNIALYRIVKGLNGIMPFDLSIKNAYEVNSDFHARHSAKERVYEYIIHNSPSRSPFDINRAYWVIHPLNLQELKEAANFLIGTHDFASFCKKVSGEISGTVRTIHKIDIYETNGNIILNIYGTAFLHNMIRIIVGTLVDLQKNNLSPLKMKEILNAKNRAAAGITAPPCGLYLKKICYNPELSSFFAAL